MITKLVLVGNHYLSRYELDEGPYDYLVRAPISGLLHTTAFSGAAAPFFPKHEWEDASEIDKRYKRVLKAVGGETIRLTGPRNEQIEGMIWTQENFRRCVETLCDSLEELGRVFHSERNQCCRVMRVRPAEDAREKVSSLKSLGIIVEVSVEKAQQRLVDQGFDAAQTEECLEKFGDSDKTLYLMYIPSIPVDAARARPTAVICGGSGILYSVYKPMIARLLMNGLNVVAFNYRGYGKSEGRPTDKRLHQDLRTVTGYLKAQGVTDQDILLYASCMGLGVASRYAAKHPGCNLLIDRSFAQYHEVAADALSEQSLVIGGVVRRTMPWVVNFDNAKHLPRVKGPIGLVLADEDEFVSPEQTQRLLNSIPEEKLQMTMVVEDYGHAGNWLKSPEYISGLELFLAKIGMANPVAIPIDRARQSA